MNLILSPWIKAIKPAEVAQPQWIDIWAPRPDFKGALYQFLIGLLQTGFSPDNLLQWSRWWRSPPDIDILSQAFSCYESAFELENKNGAAFMQDFSLNEGEEKSIAALLIESPGELTVKENRDLFIKRGQVEKICLSCAATALFTLQLNAPSGGQGHWVGLRGGGPLTTLVLCSPHAWG